MIMSVSTFIMGRGAAMPVTLLNWSMNLRSAWRWEDEGYVTSAGACSRPAERAPADVPPAEPLGPADQVHCPVGTVPRLGEGGPCRGHVEHAPACGDETC